MNSQTIVNLVGPMATGNACILAVILAGAATAAVAWRVWPFYRKMLVAHASAQPTDGRARFDALDGLRGVLCLAVLAHHAAITLNLDGQAGNWLEAYARTMRPLLP